jgi:hypothetical protein
MLILGESMPNEETGSQHHLREKCLVYGRIVDSEIRRYVSLAQPLISTFHGYDKLKWMVQLSDLDNESLEEELGQYCARHLSQEISEDLNLL